MLLTDDLYIKYVILTKCGNKFISKTKHEFTKFYMNGVQIEYWYVDFKKRIIIAKKMPASHWPINQIKPPEPKIQSFKI